MLLLAVEAPVLLVDSTTATTISISWTSAGSVVDSYEVMWQRDTSGECPEQDEGNTTITNGSTSYTMTDLEEYSTYTITLTAENFFSSATSNTTVALTQASGNSAKLSLVFVYIFAVLCHILQLHLLLQPLWG